MRQTQPHLIARLDIKILGWRRFSIIDATAFSG
jgi:hypothetical protein